MSEATPPSEIVETDVVIAGAGPVGMVLALELGRRGIDCILLNDRQTTAQHPKANAISSRTMEHLRRLGVAEAVRARGLDADHPTDVSYFTRLTGYEIGRYRQPSRAQSLEMARAGEGPWPSPEPPHRCSQLFLEEELKRAVDRLPSVDIRFGWRLEGFQDSRDHVTARADEVDGGAILNIRAKYLVGCDGAASFVRKQLGIELAGEAGVVRPMMGGPMFASYIETEPSPPWLPADRAWQYWSINGDTRSCMIHIDSHSQFVFMFAIPDERDRENVDPRPYLYNAVGREIPVKILSTLNWTAGFALVAERLAQGRVFLAGDAAHLFTPTGGMGMNTGVDDAVNLGWKMAAVLKGWGGAELLESYHIERHAIGERNVAMADRFAESVGSVPITEALETDTAMGKAERERLTQHFSQHGEYEFKIPGIFLGLNYAESPIVAYDNTQPPPDHPNDYTPNACPGSRAPHVWLGDDALYDQLGREFTLLRFGDGGDTARLRAAAEAQRIPLTILPVEDENSRALYGCHFVLIRPDQHVAWRGDSLESFEEILAQVRGA